MSSLVCICNLITLQVDLGVIPPLRVGLHAMNWDLKRATCSMVVVPECYSCVQWNINLEQGNNLVILLF